MAGGFMGRGACIVLIGVVPGLAMVVSCTFPDAAFSRDRELAGNDGGGEGSTADGRLDAPQTDAEMRTDASQRVDAAGCEDPCDCDKDTYLNKSCLDGSTDPKLVDCDDFDPLRHPN